MFGRGLTLDLKPQTLGLRFGQLAIRISTPLSLREELHPPGMGTVEPRNPVKLPESLGLRVTGLGFKVGLGYPRPRTAVLQNDSSCSPYRLISGHFYDSGTSPSTPPVHAGPIASKRL